MSARGSHLKELQASAITVLREVAASFERPTLMPSRGADITALLHLALRAREGPTAHAH